MIFLKAEKKDSEALASIAAAAPYAAKWSIAAFAESLSADSSTVFKITEGEETAGFICYSGAGDFRELVNFAVAAKFLRKGFGQELLSSSLKTLAKAGVKEVTLEVNINNKAAVSLYNKNGFKETGIRKHFYDNKDDALIMGINL